MHRKVVGLAVCCALPLLAAPALAQEPVGSEFQVNSYGTGIQRYPSIAALSSGDYVVVWQGDSANASTAGIFARRYSNDGTAQGSEFQVGSLKSFDEHKPVVAASGSTFVVAWHYLGNGTDTDVVARRFSSTGTPLGGTFQVNAFTPNKQLRPSAGMADNGDFVVAWMSYGAQDGSGIGVFGQRFSSTGATLGSEFQINTFTTSGQIQPALAVAPSGDFVVAWESKYQDGSSSGVFAKRYSSFGTMLGSEFQVNSFTSGRQYRAAVDANDAGFVIAWDSKGQDGDRNGVFAQRYASDGSALGGEFQVSAIATGVQTRPAVSLDAQGDFTVAWDSRGDVRAQRYASDGSALGSEFQVNTTTFERQYDAAVGNDGLRFLVVWDSFGQDGSSWGVFGQAFKVPTDFGDAPDPLYPTLLASNGARHHLPSALYLGEGVDDETDGQPSAGADGDDTAGVDDETGVQFTSALLAGSSASVNVTSSGTGYLNAWVDFNQDGDWADAGEAIFTDQLVSAGVNGLSYAVPVGATPGATYARFRVSSAGGDSYDGQAADGEVEDHQVTVAAPGVIVAPTDGQTLDVSSVDFSWQGYGVSQYRLKVGTTGVGSSNLFNAFVGTNTSQTVAGVPLGHVKLYARLRSDIDGTAYNNDYTYDSIYGLAQLTGPADPLTSTSHTFTWNANSGTMFLLQIGTGGFGTTDVYSSGVTTATSAAVTGLPTGGVPVYVRLFSVVNGSAQGPTGLYNKVDYVYTSAP